VSRDAFLIALGDAVDRAELALDRGEGVLSPEARQGLTRDLQDLLAASEAAGFLAAEDLPLAEDELRERLRDLVLDELPEFASRLPEPPAPVDDPAALARVMVLREVVLPELDLPLPQPPPPPPLPGGEKPQVMFSFTSLREVAGMAVLVGLVLSQMPAPSTPPVLPVEPAHFLDNYRASRPPLLARLPDGTEVLPLGVEVEAETAGPLVEGVTTLHLPGGHDWSGGAGVEAVAPPYSRVVGFRWAGQAPVAAEELGARGFQRGRRSPPDPDLLRPWRRRATLPPIPVGISAKVQVIWRGITGSSHRNLDLPLEGLPRLDYLEVRVRDRLPEGTAVPGWLEEARPRTAPPPQVHRLEGLVEPGRLRVGLRLRMRRLPEGLWRWGPRRVLSARPGIPWSGPGIPRYEFLVDTSIAGAPHAAARVDLLRILAEGGRYFKGQECRAFPLGDPAAAPVTLDEFAARLEEEGFLGPRPRLNLPPPEEGVRRIVVLQGPGVPLATLAAAAAYGPVAVLGQDVDPTLVPGRYPVEGLPLGRDPRVKLGPVWGFLGSNISLRRNNRPLALAPFHRPASLLGAPLLLDPRPETWEEPAVPVASLQTTITSGGRELGPCEPAPGERVASAEPELIFGNQRQDPASVGTATVLGAAPAWSRRTHRPRSVPRPAEDQADRHAWEQGLQAPRVAGDWAEVRERAEAWRRVDPGNPWPLLYLAEACTALGERARARRALGGIPVLTDDPRLRRVAFALALGAGDPEAVRAAVGDAPHDLTRRLDAARALVITEGPTRALDAYREAADAAYVSSLAGKVPASFAEATRAEASVVAARAAGRRAPGIFASLEPAGEPDCLALLLRDRAGEGVRVEDGTTRGGGRRTSGIAGTVAFARMREPGDEVLLGVDPGTPGPDGVVRGVLVMLRPGRPGFDVRLVALGGGPARAVHREVFEEREESR
jgi:hypothetical protein